MIPDNRSEILYMDTNYSCSEKTTIEESTNSYVKKKILTLLPPLVIPDSQLTINSPKKFPLALVQTTNILSANSPRKEKLRKKLKKLQRINALLKVKLKRKNNLENITETNFLKLCKKFVPESIQFFITEQIKLQKRHKKGNRYTEEFKRYALSLFLFYQMHTDFCKKLLIYRLSDVYKDLFRTG